MGIKENIIQLRKIHGITQKELAEIAGVTENAVSKWENGYSEPRMGAIERIAACYGLKKSHIIENGGMNEVDPVTKKLKPLPVQGMKMGKVPLYGRVHAGSPEWQPDPDIVKEVEIPQFLLDDDPECYALIAEGDCMDKVYPEGCVVVVSPKKEPNNGSVAVIRIDNYETILRRVYRTSHTLILAPDSYNPEHTDIIYQDDTEHDIQFLGRVVWFQSAKEMQ